MIPNLKKLFDNIFKDNTVNQDNIDGFLTHVFQNVNKYENEDGCIEIVSLFDKAVDEFSRVNLLRNTLTMRLYACRLAVKGLQSLAIEPEGNDDNFVICEQLEAVEKRLECVCKHLKNMEKSSDDRPHYFSALMFLCGPVSVLIQCRYKCLIQEFKDIPITSGLKLPNIEKVFQEVIRVFSDHCPQKQKKFADVNTIQVLVDVAMAAFMILCKVNEDGQKVKTIYQRMKSSLKEEATLGLLLEQEFEAYGDSESESINPDFCARMRNTIYDNIINDVYTTKDGFIQKSRFLIAQGRKYRARGFEGLDECIRSLNEAKSTMSHLYNTDKEAKKDDPTYKLVEALFLHALCMEEASGSKFLFDEIRTNIRTGLHLLEKHISQMVDGNILLLLYHVADLLLLKGCMDFHSDIYKLMIILYKRMEVPLEGCWARLWLTKSFSHALCSSQLDGAFISTFSKHCESSKPVEFWKRCLKEQESLEEAFQRCFSVHLSIHDIKKDASNLSKNVPKSNKDLYLSSIMLYDLSERLMSNGSMTDVSTTPFRCYKTLVI